MGKQGVIFYIIEEAVNNARKHANALHIWVRLRTFETGIALLEIEDDGLGFNMDAVHKSYDNRGSLGMVNLRERTEFVNGLLNINSAPGKGTRIQVYIPLTEEAADRLHTRRGKGFVNSPYINQNSRSTFSKAFAFITARALWLRRFFRPC